MKERHRSQEKQHRQLFSGPYMFKWKTEKNWVWLRFYSFPYTHLPSMDEVHTFVEKKLIPSYIWVVPKCQGIETSLLQDKDDWGWTVLHEAAAAGNKKGGILNLY